MRYTAHPANPEDMTCIESELGEFTCFVQGFGDNHADYDAAKYYAQKLSDGELSEREVIEKCEKGIK